MKRNVWHVYPTDDLENHIIDGLSCTCNPKIKKEEDGWVIIHRSFDRRSTEDGSTKAEVV